ncbi:retropepsin-like aspartic protease family protein [Fervidobacterium sp.]
MVKQIFIYFFAVAFIISGCSQSGRRQSRQSAELAQNRRESSRSESSSNRKTVVKVEKEHGVKYIWVEINGLKLRFVFDTGASSVSISSAEAAVLYKQGALSDEDILNQQYFKDATGRISEGKKINLRTVKIGDRILRNVEALIVDNPEAPLLLGQSVLEKFGKVSIDNIKGEIIFE